MTDLDTEPQHADTYVRWERRYGPEPGVGATVVWTQHGFRWSAYRAEDGWLIAGVDSNSSPSTARPHTWRMLCSRLDRMGVRGVHPFHPWQGHPARFARPPEQVAPLPEYPSPGHGVPWHRFPNIGGVGAP